VDLGMRERLFKGFGANIYGQVVTMVVQLVGVPILLHSWGTQLYGEWLILFAIPAYLSMTDLGFSQSAANDMTAQVARGDRTGALVVFQSLTAFVFFTISCMVLLTSILIFALPLEDWIHTGVMRVAEVRWVLWLLAAEVFARLPDGINHAGFRASGDFALHMTLHSTTRLLQFGAIWIAALSGGGPVAAAGAFFGVRAVATPTFALVLARRHHWLHYGFKHAARAELRRLFRPALANLAIPLAQGLNIQGMVLAVGAVLGPVAVVTFSTLRTLTRLVLQLVYSVGRAAEPELAVAYGSRNIPLCKALFVHTLRAGLWLALLAAAGLAVFGDSILAIWTHGKVAMHAVLFGWLLVSAVASVLWYGALIVLKAANRHLRVATVFVFASACVVGVAVLLLVWTGNIASAGIALLLMDAAMALFTFRAATQLLGVTPAESLVQAVDPRPLVTLVLSRVRIY
jgi:O-antigen/teichoic acid export membrane protein